MLSKPAKLSRSEPRLPALALVASLCVCAALALTGRDARAQQEGEDGDSSDSASLFAGSTVKIAEVEQAVQVRDTVTFRTVGTTSVVFQMRLKGDVNAAFKPQTRTHPQGDLAEVAAYRLARFLGMNNVAPAMPRVLSLDLLHRQLRPEERNNWDDLKAEMMPNAQDQIRGAAIYWIPELRELGIDTERGIRRWSRWLGQQGAPPYRDKSKTMARQISSMIVFDYLIGNWDRFSGANAQGDARGRNLLVRDHNVAFYDPLPDQQQRRLISRLRRVQRFSQSLVKRLFALDDRTLRRTLTQEQDPPGYEPLNDSQIRGVLDRRDGILSYIAALIDQHDEPSVLLFP